MVQEVEIVLTAHPTQINRRTLQYKHIRIAVSFCPSLSGLNKITEGLNIKSHISYKIFGLHPNSFLSLQHLLDLNDRPDLSFEDREMVIEDLVRVLEQYFYSIESFCGV